MYIVNFANEEMKEIMKPCINETFEMKLLHDDEDEEQYNCINYIEDGIFKVTY